MKKTKIICTMGPNSDNKEILRGLMENGMDVARFNFSHGTHEEQWQRLNLVREVREDLDLPIATLLDTKGPEIRTGVLKDGKYVTLKEGQKFTLTARDIEGDDSIVSLTYKTLHEEIMPGGRVLIDDGLIELIVDEIQGEDIICTVKNGGSLGQRKGVNLPGIKISLPPITEKDREDILFGIQEDFDFIAASFVRNAEAVLEIRKILTEHNSNMKIISKIENQEGIDNLDEILAVSDGIMVARGDLGVEIPPEVVPSIQKTIIRKCNAANKTVITATQMLDSMIRNPRPTRAEVTDVATAIYDGTDVVMLSGETAMGKYPVEALKMMVKIAEETESHLDSNAFIRRVMKKEAVAQTSDAVCFASVSTAHAIQAKYIIAPSISGHTARMLSKWRPGTPIIGLSPNQTTVRQMQILWGVKPFYGKRAGSTDQLVESSLNMLKDKGIVDSGDSVVITAGVVTYATRNDPATHTNIMRVVVVSEN